MQKDRKHSTMFTPPTSSISKLSTLNSDKPITLPYSVFIEYTNPKDYVAWHKFMTIVNTTRILKDAFVTKNDRERMAEFAFEEMPEFTMTFPRGAHVTVSDNINRIRVYDSHSHLKTLPQWLIDRLNKK